LRDKAQAAQLELGPVRLADVAAQTFGQDLRDTPARAPLGGLVHRLVCSWHMAAGQLAVFQGASEAPISLRCSSVTYRFRYASSSRLANGPF
jgi:hypothetical protein